MPYNWPNGEDFTDLQKDGYSALGLTTVNEYLVMFGLTKNQTIFDPSMCMAPVHRTGMNKIAIHELDETKVTPVEIIQDVKGSKDTFTMTEKDYFAFRVRMGERLSTDKDYIAEGIVSGSESFHEKFDSYLLTLGQTYVDPYNVIAGPNRPIDLDTGDVAEDLYAEMDNLLTKAKVGKNDRVSPIFSDIQKLVGKKYAKYDNSGKSVRTNGWSGDLFTFGTYVTSNYPVTVEPITSTNEATKWTGCRINGAITSTSTTEFHYNASGAGTLDGINPGDYLEITATSASGTAVATEIVKVTTSTADGFFYCTRGALETDKLATIGDDAKIYKVNHYYELLGFQRSYMDSALGVENIKKFSPEREASEAVKAFFVYGGKVWADCVHKAVKAYVRIKGTSA